MRPENRKILFVFVLSVLVASIMACGTASTPIPATNTANPVPTEALKPTFTPIPLDQVVILVANPTNETGANPVYTIQADTPFFQRSEDLRVITFNNEMSLLTQEEIAKFKDNVAQTQPIPGMAGSSYIQKYELKSPPGNLVSLKFSIMIYIEGAAHPGTHSRTVTYDLQAGKDVTLDQLFLPDADYLQKISNYCIAQLKTRNIGFEAFSSGAEPIPANYGNWNITADGLLITFDEYQVAAYAAGAQQVLVPYSELQTLVDPHGPLAGFLH
jgi:hypothetical protein